MEQEKEKEKEKKMSYRDPKTGRWSKKPAFQPVLIFVYGTLKRGYRLNPMLRECDFIGEGETARKYRMISVGYPVIMPDGDGHVVTGELYRVKDDYTLRRLDAVESGYNRTPVEVTLKSGPPMSCFIYEGKDYWKGSHGHPVDPQDGKLTYENEHAKLLPPVRGYSRSEQMD